MRKSTFMKGVVLLVFAFLIALFVYYRAGKLQAYKPERTEIMSSSKFSPGNINIILGQPDRPLNTGDAKPDKDK